jgi:probable HAF family extracellular repeat protein
MRGSIALRTKIATHPRMIAAVAATVAGSLALLITFVGGLVGASSASAASPTYTVEDLGTNFSPEDINRSGHVVGEGFTFTTGCGRARAILYSAGQRHYIASCDTASAALGINDSGEVVGVSGDRAFLYEQGQEGQEGQMQDLGTLPGGTRSQALDINNTGEIVGWSATFTGDPEAFLYSNGQMQDLGTLGDAVGINDTGQVAGHANTTTGERHAFLYTKITGEMQDLGTLTGFPGIRATDINDSGEVVGYGLYRPADEEDYQDHAFLYEEGQMRDLGTLGGTNSWAWGVNDTGQVVGDAETSTGESHAFLYSGGQMQDLNDLIPAESGWELHNARAINARGQIVGIGQINGGQGRAFLATPNTMNTGDTTPPQLNLPNGVSQTATSPNGATVSYTATATDDVDGDLAVDCSPASGSTFPLGITTVNCSAEDAAGNVAVGSFEVRVLYDFGNGSGGGFSEPVSSSVLNQVKAGAGVPVKFGLGGDFGLDIFAAGYPTSRTISCETGLPTDPVEETIAVSASGLRYDASTGQYIYTWRTDKTWSDTCRELILKFKDGTEHTAKFTFTK